MIFLTDGQPNERLEDIKRMSDDLKYHLKSKEVTVDFHTLGYGCNHNPNVCLALTESNTGTGTFQYITEDNKVQEAIDAITHSMNDSVLKSRLQLTDETINLRLLFDREA